MTILTVVGARPQFIKVAAVSRVLRAAPGMKEILVHTGQHYDANMSDVFFDELEIPKPDYHLNIGGGNHGAMTGKMLEGIESVLLKEKPDWVLVYGDTNSTLAGALAAVKLHIPVAHVEAGLRSFNRKMPEEINRILTDHASNLLFAPTETAVTHLRNEGLPESRIVLAGDVMYDAALYYGDKAQRTSSILKTLGVEPKRYVLATVHRAENTDDPARLRAVLEGLADVARELSVVLPIHPRTRGAVSQRLGAEGEKLLNALKITDPVGYLDMVMLERNATVIATDSGGVQKEAFFYRVPCVTLRGETEWTELVEMGWNRLVPAMERAAIRDAVHTAIRAPAGREASPFGDGHAAQAIVSRLQLG